MSAKRFFPLVVLALLQLSECKRALATAGPPLITDDPGTPGSKNWEINVAYTLESNKVEKRIELPLLDINYGLGDKIQLKYEVPYVISKSDEDDSKNSGIDRSDIGVKWRFVEKESAGVALSTYPQIAFKSPVSDSTRKSDTDTSTDFLLPVEAEESSGKWDFNQEVGLHWLKEQSSQWECGIATSYSILESVAVLAELHGQVTDRFADYELLANVGTIIGVGRSSILFSLGKTFEDFGSAPHRTLLYAGWQFHL